jgi:hypothetical protein
MRMDAIAGINLQVPRIASSKIDPDCLAISWDGETPVSLRT